MRKIDKNMSNELDFNIFIGGENMANIQAVDYRNMATQAVNIRNSAKELNTQVSNAYAEITNMHNDWYGKRYNALVGEFNKLVPDVNNLLQLVVDEIPTTLITIANNYSQADGEGKVGNASAEGYTQITTIDTPEDVGMKFVTTNVEQTRTKVENKFDSAKGKMTDIQTTLNKISWNSDAATAFKNKFTSLKTKIETSFDNIKSSFTTLANAARDDIESAETANTVS